MLLGTTRVSLPNGISLRRTTLVRCMSVTDNIQTDRRRYGNMCRSRRNRFRRRRLKTTKKSTVLGKVTGKPSYFLSYTNSHEIQCRTGRHSHRSKNQLDPLNVLLRYKLVDSPEHEFPYSISSSDVTRRAVKMLQGQQISIDSLQELINAYPTVPLSVCVI